MQPETLDALRHPACFPEPADSVELIETHISWLLLAGDHAWKIKKPVDFGFLDFSTLALRRHYCEEELRLNRRHAPELYLQLDTINGTAAAPVINGDGPILDYAVRMRRFDPAQTFDRRLQRAELAGDEVEALADELARLHEHAAIAPADGWHGSPEQVLGPMADNFEALFRELEDDSDRELVARLQDWTQIQADAVRDRLQQRLQAGFVREGHGDAHLGNVVRHQGHTRLFDCIEFSADLRWIDIVSDAAFTFMDLLDRDASALAWQFLDAWLTRTGDHAGLDLLPLYLVYRALVRAKVGVLRMSEAPPASERQALLAQVRGYLALASRWAAPGRPELLLTMGVSGSGKSHLAGALLQQLGLVRLRSDVERKRLAGLAHDARSDSRQDADLYSSQQTARTYAELLARARGLLRAGFSVIVDATFLQQQQRAPFLELASELQLPCRVLACHADPDILRRRVHERSAAGTDPSEADLAILEAQLQQQERPAPQEHEHLVIVDTGEPDALARTLAALT